MGIEHVYVVYDPTRPFNRFDLGFRKVATSIEGGRDFDLPRHSHYSGVIPVVFQHSVELSH